MLPSHQKGADVVLYAPADELAASAEEFTPNPPRKKKGLSSAELSQLEEAMDLYSGNSRFLVRTALIRAEGWDAEEQAPKITGPEDVAKLCQHLRYADVEYLVVITLDNKGALRAIHETSIGGKSSTQAHIDQLLKVATLTGSSGMFMVHNHPSGDPKPSQEDVTMTVRVAEACKCAGFVLMDHVIVGARGFLSFMSAGLPPFR